MVSGCDIQKTRLRRLFRNPLIGKIFSRAECASPLGGAGLFPESLAERKSSGALTQAPGLTYFLITVPSMADYLAGIDLFGGSLCDETSTANAELRDSTRASLVIMTQKLAADLELRADGKSDLAGCQRFRPEE